MSNPLFDVIALAVQAQFNPNRTRKYSGTAPPVCLVGPSGAGKNKGYIEPVVTGLGLACLIVNTPRNDAAEFNGIPWASEEKGCMEFLAPDWAVEVSKDPGKYVVFFDEASDAPRSTQAAMHGLLTDGDCGNVSIRGAAMVMCMNPPEVATTGGTISMPMGNRLFQVQAIVDRMNVIRQMRQGAWDVNKPVKLSPDWVHTIPASMAMVGSFLSNFPQHLIITEEDLQKRGEDMWKPAPTPRSWDFFWTLRAAAHASGQKHLMYLIAEGTVGAPGIEYLQWEKDLEFGDPETWLSAPGLQTMPTGDDQRFAIINAVMAAVLANNTPER